MTHAATVLLLALTKDPVVLIQPNVDHYRENHIPPDVFQVPVSMFDVHAPDNKVEFHALFMVPGAWTKGSVVGQVNELASMISKEWNQRQTDPAFPFRANPELQLPAIHLDTTLIQDVNGVFSLRGGKVDFAKEG